MKCTIIFASMILCGVSLIEPPEKPCEAEWSKVPQGYVWTCTNASECEIEAKSLGLVLECRE